MRNWKEYREGKWQSVCIIGGKNLFAIKGKIIEIENKSIIKMCM